MRLLLYNPTAGRPGVPRYIRPPDDIFDIGFDQEGRGGQIRERLGDQIITPPPPVVISLDQAAREVAGGFTPEQIDLAARMETQEGASIGIFYGELLFGATNVVSHKYEAGTPRNTFSVLHGEGWGGLGRRGEWEGVVKAWYLGEELTKRFDYTIYVDDRVPAGATIVNDEDGWNWITKGPEPYFGRYCHQSADKSGQHQHHFADATQTMSVVTGDILYFFIWLDPASTPTEVMIQFQDGTGSFEHRAYWGANSINLGTNGTNSRRQVSASVPATGQWVRLDVPAADVGMEGQTCKGMGFTLFGGLATWDQAGRYNNTASGNTGYIFRPGYIAPDNQDIVQRQILTTWPTGVAQSGSATSVVRLNTTQSAQDRPDGYKARIKCRRVPNYDSSGAEILTDYGYSTNPARVAADRILHFYERRYPTNLDLALQKFTERIYWPSWTAWRDNCEAQIPWDKAGDGVSVFVKRFEAHIGFPTDLSLAAALDQLTGLSCAMWQDTGKQLIFLPSGTRTPVHNFHPGNIVSIRRSVIDLRKRPNRFVAAFRDEDDEFLGVATIEPPDNTPQHDLRQESKNRVGEIRSEREFSNMNQSQARRVLEYRARLEHDSPERAFLVGMADAMKVLKGDLVTVTHPALGWDSQLCLVLGITVRSAESSADEVACRLQKLDGPLYDDAAHRPRQVALTL